MQNIKHTLAEQMQIDNREISYRKSLIEFTQGEELQLVSVKPYIVANVENIVERFYEKQVVVPEISLLIGDKETLKRLKKCYARLYR